MIGFFPSWDAYSAIFSLESAIDDSQKYMGTKWGHGCLKTYSYRESTWTFRILWYSDAKLSCGQLLYTDGNKILHTLLVKYYNHLLDKQSFERSRDEVTYFYVGDVFCKHLGTTYTDLQEKIFAEISGKKVPNVLKRALEKNFFGYNIRLLPEHSLGSNPYPRIY